MATVTPERIVDEAMDMIDTGGEASLAMRPLAARFGVTPMALYRHFPDRDALLVAVVDRVSQRLVFPQPASDPAQCAIDLALCLHDFLVEYPWLIRLIATGRLASPAGMRFPEGFVACARRAGLDDDAAFAFYRTMFAAVLGQATITAATQERPPGPLADRLSPPATSAVATLAPRWAELHAAATPARVFASIARLLEHP